MKNILLSVALVLGLMLVGCGNKQSGTMAPLQKAAPAVSQELRLPSLFADHMVLQQGKPIAVWGWMAPGEKVTVRLAGQEKSAEADSTGAWMVKLKSEKAGGPHELSVSTKGGEKVIRNVLVGEVWVCSGQSNMEWPLKATNDAEAAIAAAKHPNIRLFTVPKRTADVPQADVEAKWVECTPETAATFSAVAYYFGRELNEKLNVPVGLIHTSWGGSPIEVWMSDRLLASDPKFQPALTKYREQVQAFEAATKKHAADAEAAQKEGKPAPNAPRRQGWYATTLYNAMIAPLVPYSIAGAIWYQGESNASAAKLYRDQMPAMINGWREDWGDPKFTFVMVQLANYMARKPEPSDSAWAELREAQAMTAATNSKTGLAVAIDIGEEKDIHPRNKLDVGRRLALAALAIEYRKPVEYSGPIFDKMKIDGNKARLSFRHSTGGLVAKGGDLKGFAVAGADRKFYWADAQIDGSTVVVSSKEVPQPVAVRYAWADNPECNLYNGADLPAVPFRTDDWERK